MNADEEDFLSIVVGNETVLRWEEKWIAYELEGDVGKIKLAVLLREIAATLTNKGEVYTSEASSCGLAERAVATMKRIQDSDMMDDLSSIIVACSGPSASGDRVTTLTFGRQEIVIKEGALADGVGAKLWRVARIMCERMIRDDETSREENDNDKTGDEGVRMIRGKTVLEVGAGVGACGFLAAKLGAKSVVISDYVDQLLLNLRDALTLNAPEEESEDNGWTRGNIAIRFIDWEDAVERGDVKCDVGSGSGTPPRLSTFTSLTPMPQRPPAALDGDSSRTVAPSVDDGLFFDTIIGTDVLYEWPMVNSLSSCIKQRLAPGGTAYICNAIRDQEMFDALVECIRSKDLRVDVERLEVETTRDEGWCQEDSYEGGFVFVTVRHAPP